MVLITIKRNLNGKKFNQTFDYSGDLNNSVAEALIDLNSKKSLLDVNGKEASKISFQYKCRHQLCGSCAMVINGIPRLACGTILNNLLKENDEIVLGPLSKFPNVEDLVVDRSCIEESFKEMDLGIKQKDDNKKHLELEDEASKCITCGCCLEICPTYNQNNNFKGAVSLVHAFKPMYEEKDKKHRDKMKISYEDDFFSYCEKSFACEETCPKGIPISKLMDKMNDMVVWNRKISD